jgi:hypothetical protein
MINHERHSKKCVRLVRRGGHIIQKKTRKTNKKEAKGKTHSV